MKNAYKFIIGGVVALALLVGGYQVKADAGSLLEIIGDKAGYYLAQLIYNGQADELSKPAAPKALGGAGDLYSLKKIASIGVTTNVRTTTITNSTSVDWLMDKITFYASSTAGGAITVTPTIHIAIVTSTDTMNEAIVLGGFGGALGWVTSTPFKISTSTFNADGFGAAARNKWVLPAGHSLVIVNSTNAMTTTEGVAALEYYSL